MPEKLICHADRSEIVRWTILRSRSPPYPPSSSQARIGVSIPEPERTHYPVFPCVKDRDLITLKYRYFFFLLTFAPIRNNFLTVPVGSRFISSSNSVTPSQNPPIPPNH